MATNEASSQASGPRAAAPPVAAPQAAAPQGPVPATVPASAYSRLGTETNFAPSKLVIGTNSLALGQQLNTQSFWFVAVDLENDLQVVANEVSTNATTVPASIQQLAGSAQYFLFVVSNSTYTPMVPQGALYSFLAKVGAGTQLARIEQLVEQIGTGIVVRFSYILAATMAFGDLPGFEELSTFTPAILTMGFLPVDIGGKIVYAPIRTSSSAGS